MSNTIKALREKIAAGIGALSLLALAREIAATRASRSDERAKYPDGRTIPQIGDEVYNLARGAFGMRAVIRGIVKQGSSGLVVGITGGGDMLGSRVKTKSTPLSDEWTLVDEKHPTDAAAEAAEARLKADTEKRQAEYDAKRAADIERNGTLTAADVPLSGVMAEGPDGEVEIITVAAGGLYAEERGIDGAGWKLRPDVPTPRDGSLHWYESGDRRALFTDGWHEAAYARHADAYIAGNPADPPAGYIGERGTAPADTAAALAEGKAAFDDEAPRTAMPDDWPPVLLAAWAEGFDGKTIASTEAQREAEKARGALPEWSAGLEKELAHSPDLQKPHRIAYQRAMIAHLTAVASGLKRLDDDMPRAPRAEDSDLSQAVIDARAKAAAQPAATEPATSSDITDYIAVSQEIGRQLGGSKFKAMTGATNFAPVNEGRGGLKFNLPTGLSQINGKSTKINRVKVTLNGSDTYDVEFGGARAGAYKAIKSVDGVYADSLREVFTRYTGLDVSLGTAGGVAGRDGGADAKGSPEHASARYRYGLHMRPAGIGAVPPGQVAIEAADPSVGDFARHGVIVYDRQLTEKEVKDYELVPLDGTDGQPLQAPRIAPAVRRQIDDALSALRYLSEGYSDWETMVEKGVDEDWYDAMKKVGIFRDWADRKGINASKAITELGGQPEKPPATRSQNAGTATENEPAMQQATEDQTGPDRDYLNGMIAGTVDMADPSIADKLIEMAGRYAEDAEMMGLMEQAAGAYERNAMELTKSL